MPTFSVTAQSENPTKTSVEAREFEMTVDEPENAGGTNEGPNPLEYLIGGQAGCLNATGHQVANDMGLDLDSVAIEIEGEFDPAKFMGESTDERAGFQDVSVTIEADTDADEETLQQWAEQTEERCPVTDNVQHSTPMDLSVSKA
jgi:uncharacterized OsmC-like protein